jgi:hypothetical protein
MIVCVLLSLKLGVSNVVLVDYMAKSPAVHTTPLLAAVVVTDLEADSVGGGVGIFDELLHNCLST